VLKVSAATAAILKRTQLPPVVLQLEPCGGVMGLAWSLEGGVHRHRGVRPRRHPRLRLVRQADQGRQGVQGLPYGARGQRRRACRPRWRPDRGCDPSGSRPRLLAAPRYHALLPASSSDAAELLSPLNNARSVIIAAGECIRRAHAACRIIQEAAALRGISGCSPHRAECGRLSGGVPVEGLDGLPNNGSGDALGEGWLQDVRVLRRQQHGDGSTRARLLSSESSASLTLAARPRVARRGPLSLGEGTLIRAQ